MPLGLQAVDMVRIEAGLAFAGYEFCDQTDPFEAGIGFTVPLAAKNEDFIGRDALLRRKEHPQKMLVGLEMEGEETVATAIASISAAPRSAWSPAPPVRRS
jgi:aminomethyltransferase